MRIGTLAYDCIQGLGLLVKSFVDAGVVTDVAVIKRNLKERPEQGWYPKAPSFNIRELDLHADALKEFCSRMDIMLFFETPFLYDLIPYCRDRGVKTVLSLMHECTHSRLLEPKYSPDLYLCPSLLDQTAILENLPLKPSDGSGVRRTLPTLFLPIPVDVQWRQRTEAKVLVHNAGWGGLKGRNGTEEVMESLDHVKSKAEFIIRSQKSLDITKMPYDGDRVKVQIGTLSNEQLYDEGDVFLFPESFNGLSLPLQEAYASGMLVMCGARFPMNTWLPQEPMIQVSGYTKERIGGPYLEYDRANYDPKRIAETIDHWYGADITEFSHRGKYWAEQNSWSVLKPQYMKVLEDLL